MDIQPRPTSLYRYYDEQSILLYVGITDRGITRNREHNSTKDWWRFVKRQEVEHFDTRPEAAAREKALILSHRPPFNRQHNPDHAAMRETYLIYAAMPGDGAQHKSLGGVEASRNARQQITQLGHRMPMKRNRVRDRKVTYRLPSEFSALARCINYPTTIVLRNPTRIGRMGTVTQKSGLTEVTFTVGPGVATPAVAHLKLRVTQKPYTIWAYEAVAA